MPDFSGRPPLFLALSFVKQSKTRFCPRFPKNVTGRQLRFTKSIKYAIIVTLLLLIIGENALNVELYEKTEYALSLIKDGNDNGVDLLYSFMGKTMLMVARGVVRDSFFAEDAVQDSFLKIVKNIGKYKKGTNAYAWVCKIVRNTALNALKSSLNHPTENIDEFFCLSDGNDVEDKTTTQLLVEKLMNSLAPPIVKQMIYMKYFLDMTVREIAKEIGKSKSYVAKKIAKAEEFMKTLL